MDKQIILKNVDFIYQPDLPSEKQALTNVSLEIENGEFMAIVGKTGSGKSTLVQMINGLLKPTLGDVTVGDIKINNQTNNHNLSELRQKVGMIFQFPEKQLFEDTVLKDVAFGPLNFGDDEPTAKTKAIKALSIVGVFKKLYDRSPFELSGGQMRRVAIAGTIACEPQILILDEPTVGLDPNGKNEILKIIHQLNEKGVTIIMVTHDMDVVAQNANRVVVMNKGRVSSDSTPRELFANPELIANNSLALPDSVQIYYDLVHDGIQLSQIPLTANEVVEQITQKRSGVK